MKNYQWDQRFIELKAFIEENGHSCIPSTSQYKSLQAWVGTQRKLHKIKQADAKIQSALTDEREERLNAINFDWQTSHDYMWQQRLQQLKAYKEEYGHVNLNKSDGVLGSWVETQRTEMRFKIDGHHTHLTDERIAELESVGFVWSIRETVWDENYDIVLQCHKEKKEVPQRVRGWLRDQKRLYRSYVRKMGDEVALSPERAEKLSCIFEIKE